MDGEEKDQERARQRAGADASTETPGNQRPDRLGLEGILGQESARRGRSQGCDFLSLDFSRGSSAGVGIVPGPEGGLFQAALASPGLPDLSSAGLD